MSDNPKAERPSGEQDSLTKRVPPRPDPPELRPMYPVCPYCGTDPATIASTPFQMGPLTVLALFCSQASCRKILALQVVGAQEPKIIRPDQPGWRN